MPLEQHQRTKRLDYPKAEIHLLATNPYEDWRADACAKEPGTVTWLETHIQPGDVIYDIGACVGAYSLIAAHLAGPEGTVYAIEPSAFNFAALVANVMINARTRIVKPLGIAVDHTNRLLELSHSNPLAGAASHTLQYDPTDTTHPVFTWQLDDARTVWKLKRPNLIKIDVDGTEEKVLEGARRTLRDELLRSVMVEVNTAQEDREKEIVAALDRAGFAVTERHPLLSKGYFNYQFDRVRDVLGPPVSATQARKDFARQRRTAGIA